MNLHTRKLKGSTMSARSRGLCGLLLLLAVAACDTEVTNPGPIQDEFVSDRTAAASLVNGAGRGLAQGLNWVLYTSAAVAREIHPAGSTGSFGINQFWQNGILNSDDSDLDTHWEQAQRARWVAEEAVRRLVDMGPPPAGNTVQTAAQYNTQLQQAYVWAGFANRLLGENMCEAVIDGGANQPSNEFLKRAEDNFTKAIAVGTGNLQTAAYAGRASVRLLLGKYAEAAADAALVPNTFSYTIGYFDLGDDAQRNRLQWAMFNSPYRAHTQWSTWYKDYFDATKDPRVAYTTTTLQGDAAIECCGRVPFLPQAKYTVNRGASAVRLASGREMRLLEAEVKLRNNDLAGALSSMNAVRALVTPAQAALTAANVTDAWTLLKRERGIELWLEGRRLGDMRRWKETNTPGTLNPLELPGSGSHLAKQDLCFPISKSERQTNPNVKS
jgi:starch-binding outer membrane protein, SusD/RagB family